MPPSPHRVLFVNHTVVLGGAEWSLLDLLANLDPGRVTPEVAYPGGGMLAAPLERLGVPVHPAPLCRFTRSRNPWRLALQLAAWARGIAAVGRVLDSQDFDLVHANGTPAALAAVPAARRRGLPAIWHCRDLVPLGPAARVLRNRCARVVAISGAVADHLARELGPDAPVVTIPNGVDLRRLAPRGRRVETRRELGLAPDDFVVATLGQLVPWKNHRRFIEAAALAARELPRARFLVVGADLFGDHPAYIRELHALAATRGLAERLVWTGYRADPGAVLEAADVLVHPAEREPFGRAVAEAMALGVPVVAADDAGPRELIRPGQDGILLPLGADRATLAQAIVTLATDPALAARLGAAARDRIRAHFDVRATAERLMDLYDEALRL
jgi:glycosyltransferase involved in cell wall biosynthesis